MRSVPANAIISPSVPVPSFHLPSSSSTSCTEVVQYFCLSSSCLRLPSPREPFRQPAFPKSLVGRRGQVSHCKVSRSLLPFPSLQCRKPAKAASKDKWFLCLCSSIATHSVCLCVSEWSTLFVGACAQSQRSC